MPGDLLDNQAMIIWATLRRTVGALMVGGILASCTGPTTAPPEPLSPSDLTRRVEVYTVGFRGISDKYIQPLSVADIALGGLQGLSSIDPALHAERRADRVKLSMDGREIASDDAPGLMDARGWGSLTAKFEQTARLQSSLIGQATDEKVFEAVFDGVLADLDVFSRYAGAAQAKRNRARREGFGGIGIRFKITAGRPLVTDVHAGTPAAAAGMRVGDEITHIAGTALLKPKVRDIVNQLRGPIHSDVNVGIYRASDDRSRTLTLTRKHIVPPTVETEFRNGVGYLKISSFNQATAEGVAKALRKMRRNNDVRLKGLIVDLRGNPGGLLKQSVKVADLLLTHGHIVSTRGRHPDSLHHYEAGGRDLADGLPIAVLVDGKSASASEIVAAALQDQGRAAIIGTASFGKGTVQTVIRLPNDGEITLTWSRFIAPSGYTLHGLGVRPVICTSGHDGPPSKAIERFTDAETDTRAVYTSWRRALFDQKDLRTTLRRTCKSQRRRSDTDRKVARFLLDDENLYARAIGITSSESQALKTPTRP